MGILDFLKKKPTAQDIKFRNSAYNDASDTDEDIKNTEDMYGDDEDERVKIEKENEEKTKTMKAIENLSASLIEKRDKAVIARTSCGIEQIWREDELAFEGMDEASIRTRMIDYATEQASRSNKNEARRSRVVINIVRPKCETAEGRFTDILLPTDDKNWGLKPTPDPNLSDNIGNKEPAQLKSEPGKPIQDKDGNPQTVGAIALKNIAIAKKKMKGMETVIDDQLTECSFNGECRKVIRNAIRLGTGILKGPSVVKDMKRKWEPKTDGDVTVRVLKMGENQKPASKSVDPWDVYPDPECKGDATKAGYIWERESILPSDLRKLIGARGYMTDQIVKVLDQEPTKVTIASEKDNRFVIRYNEGLPGESYEKWEYNGDLSRSDLEALGCNCDSIDVKIKNVSGCVVLINDVPIKIMLNPVDTGDMIYDFFQWSTRSGVPWGVGIARELMWPQRVVTAAWRAMMDNAGDSSGANIVIGENIEPVNSVMEITGKKLWRMLGEAGVEDARKSFAQFQIQNNQQELQAIIELALKFADIESNIPMIFGGEKGELPETLGATNILVDSNNVALRARVKLWDDRITRPHLTRYYDWNMQYGKDESIKGDYNVDPRGTSVLLERDQQAKMLEEILPLRSDPELKILVDWEGALRKILRGKNLDVILPDEKIQENRDKLAEQPPPVDPKVEGNLKVAQVRVQGDLQKASLNQQSDMTELQFKAEQARLDREHEAQMAILNRDMKMMELSSSSGIELSKIKATLSSVGMKLKTQVALAKDKDTVPAEQVATPPTEPAGRAKDGEAYQS